MKEIRHLFVEKLIEANELVHLAYEADPKKGMRLCEEALDVCIECTDALREWTYLSDLPDVIKLKLYEAAKVTGMRELITRGISIEGNKGDFWEVMETRPFIRACFDTMMTYVDLGYLGQAIDQAEEILEYNKSDNMGARYYLVSFYLMARDYTRAKKIFRKYSSDDTAAFTYPRALLAFLTDSPDKEEILAAAIGSNPFVIKYLTTDKLPEDTPPYYTLGSKEEAANYVMEFNFAWLEYPEAINWLLKHSSN